MNKLSLVFSNILKYKVNNKSFFTYAYMFTPSGDYSLTLNVFRHKRDFTGKFRLHYNRRSIGMSISGLDCDFIRNNIITVFYEVT